MVEVPEAVWNYIIEKGLESMRDERDVKALEIQIGGDPGNYKVWVNTEKGCRYRAYKVTEIDIKGFPPVSGSDLEVIRKALAIAIDNVEGVEAYDIFVDHAKELREKLKME